jgi:hypothetical protein
LPCGVNEKNESTLPGKWTPYLVLYSYRTIVFCGEWCSPSQNSQLAGCSWDMCSKANRATTTTSRRLPLLVSTVLVDVLGLTRGKQYVLPFPFHHLTHKNCIHSGILLSVASAMLLRSVVITGASVLTGEAHDAAGNHYLCRETYRLLHRIGSSFHRFFVLLFSVPVY